MVNQIISYLKRNKEGIIIGAIVGWLVSTFISPTTFDATLIAQSIVDPLIPGESVIEIAENKITIALIFLGATVGSILDEITPEGKFFKRRSR